MSIDSSDQSDSDSEVSLESDDANDLEREDEEEQQPSNEQKYYEQKYSGIEHKIIGDRAFKNFLEKHLDVLSKLRSKSLIETNKAGYFILQVNPRLALTPGDLVFLMGDFYGIPEEPICLGESLTERMKLFEGAFNSLALVKDEDGLAEMARIKKLVRKEGRAILKGLEEGESPKDGLEHNSAWIRGGHSDFYYGMATRYVRVPLVFFISRYVRLAPMNFDHFGKDAEKAFEAGYESAIATARWAGSIQIHKSDSKEVKREKEDARYNGLIQALAKVLAACHFLTDLFASGHMRTPRRELVEKSLRKKLGGAVKGTNKTASFNVKAQHDEDGNRGLWVTSDMHKTPWKAYGDHCYFIKENKTNKKRALEAVEATLESILGVFLNPTVESTYDFRKYIPKPCSPKREITRADGKVERNHYPLFKMSKDPNAVTKEKVLTRRKNLRDPYDSERKYKWSQTKTLLAHSTFWHSKDGKPEALSEAEKIVIKKELKESGVTPEKASRSIVV